MAPGYRTTPSGRKGGAARGLRLLAYMLCLALVGCKVPLDFDPEPRQPSRKEILDRLSSDSVGPLPPITRADVLSAGVLTRIPESARSETADFCPDTHRQVGLVTTYVKAELLNEFGYEFVLLPAGGNAGRAVTAPVNVRVRHPSIRNPVTGQVEQERTTLTVACLGKRSYAGWQFDTEWELVDGVWTIDLMYQGQVLATRSFTVQGGLPAVGVEKRETRRIGLNTATDPGAGLKGAGKDAREAERWKPARSATGIAVLVSSNRNPDFASNAARTYSAAGYPAKTGTYRDPRDNSLWYTVLLGDFSDIAAARQAAARFREREGREAFVVAATSHSAERRTEGSASAATVAPPAHAKKTAPEEKTRKVGPSEKAQQGNSSEKAAKGNASERAQKGNSASRDEGGSSGGFVVQAAAFLDQHNARTYQTELLGRGWKSARLGSYRDASGRLWHCVRLGSYPTRREAEAAAANFRQREGRNAVVMPASR